VIFAAPVHVGNKDGSKSRRYAKVLRAVGLKVDLAVTRPNALTEA
jgi:hypothetical protein